MLSRLPEQAVRAEREWEKVRHHAPERINLALGWSAVDALCAASALHDAATAAAAVLAAARARLANAPDESGRLRDLSVSLNKVGQVAWARGALGEAEAAYRESLGLSRQLAGRLGDTRKRCGTCRCRLTTWGRWRGHGARWGRQKRRTGKVWT